MVPHECFGDVLADDTLYSLGENLIIDGNKDLHVFPIPLLEILQSFNIIAGITLSAECVCKIIEKRNRSETRPDDTGKWNKPLLTKTLSMYCREEGWSKGEGFHNCTWFLLNASDCQVYKIFSVECSNSNRNPKTQSVAQPLSNFQHSPHHQ